MSPDGRHLYFSSSRSGGFNQWRVAVDDESTGRTAGDPLAVPIPRQGIGHLSISADGTWVAMSTITFQDIVDALAFNPVRGTVGARRRVTNSSEPSAAPAVSADGQWLAFFKQLENGHEDLWVVKTDGTGIRQLTSDAARDRAPRWSADGTRLMFSSDRSGKYQVWTIAADGGGLMQVTDYPTQVIHPVWSPVARAPWPALSFRIPRSWCSTFGCRPASRRWTSCGSLRMASLPPRGLRTGDGLPVMVTGGLGAASWCTTWRRGTTRSSRGLGVSVWLPDGRRLVFTGEGVVSWCSSIPRRGPAGPCSRRPGRSATPDSPDAREIYINVYRTLSDLVLARLTGGPP